MSWNLLESAVERKQLHTPTVPEITTYNLSAVNITNVLESAYISCGGETAP
jgi:hypothetical protein